MLEMAWVASKQKRNITARIALQSTRMVKHARLFRQDHARTRVSQKGRNRQKIRGMQIRVILTAPTRKRHLRLRSPKHTTRMVEHALSLSTAASDLGTRKRIASIVALRRAAFMQIIALGLRNTLKTADVIGAHFVCTHKPAGIE